MPETLVLKVEKLVPGGDAMARHEGRIIFVPGALPGEEIQAQVVESKKDFAKAELREVLVASPDRVTPPCSLAGICGGCDWLHIDPVAQARLKIEIAQDALRRTGGLEWPNLQIETGSPLGYRNRLQVHADRSGAVGFLGRRGHDFVPVKTCPVAHPAFAPLFAQGASPQAPSRFHAFATADQVWREDEKPGDEVRLRILDRELVFPVNGFFQSNLEMLERLIPFALEGLSGGTAFDLYSGVGLFATFLLQNFTSVVCVESNRDAVQFARRNVGEKNGFFVPGLLEDMVGGASNAHLARRPDAVIVDPPREGLNEQVRSWLKRKAVSTLVYVSCNPVTLARDLKDLLSGPYKLEDLRLFDFYPQTSHIEAVAKLKLKD